MIAQRESEIRSLLGDTIWGSDEETLEGLIGALLLEKGLTIATMESCTGGLLASTITDVPGSSKYFKGGLVAYTNGAKISYGVSSSLIERYGAISPEVAADMAGYLSDGAKGRAETRYTTVRSASLPAACNLLCWNAAVNQLPRKVRGSSV